MTHLCQLKCTRYQWFNSRISSGDQNRYSASQNSGSATIQRIT